MALNPTNLFIQASPLPATFKGTPNDMFVEMIKRMKILSPSGTNFIYVGDTEPTSNVGPWLKGGTQWWVWNPSTKRYNPQDISASFTPAFFIGRSLPPSTDPTVWLQTESDPTSSNPLGYGNMVRWFTWNGSIWVSPHPITPNASERRIWRGTETELWAYDGGDGTNPSAIAPTDTTGAMWQVDADFNFRFPAGVGTSPVTYDGNPANSITLGGTGGEERHVITEAELAAHAHFIVNSTAGYQNPAELPTATKFAAVQGVGIPDSNKEYALEKSLNNAVPDIAPSSTRGSGTSHQNLPPYLGVWFIKRTARKFYIP